jgi:V/A-type H+-transporting ATPase subunit I
MAVSKMEKMTLIAAAKDEGRILQLLQGLQTVEIKHVFHSKEEAQQIKAAYPFLLSEQPETNLRHYENLLRELQAALLCMKRFSTKLPKVKRKNCTLEELEAEFDEALLTEELAKINQLQSALSALQQEHQQLAEDEANLIKWQYLDVVPQTFSLKSARVLSGSINVANQAAFLEQLQQAETIYVEEFYQTTHDVYLVLIYLEEQAHWLHTVLEKFSFQQLEYPYERLPKEEYRLTQERYQSLGEQEKNIKAQLTTYQGLYESFCLAEEVLLAIIHREKAKKYLLSASAFFVLQAWLPTEEKNSVIQKVTQNLPQEKVYLTFEEPTAVDIETDIPIQLKNTALVKPFEMLTEMYSLPKYKEIDPTPAMTPFYLVFFGMMVADIGYGLIMLIAAAVALKAFVLPRSMKRFAKFFFILSVPTIIWGFIYSSFFGAALPKTFLGFSLPFPILSTTEDVNTILIMSVIFGFIQLFVGLIIYGVQLTKQKQYLESLHSSFAWQGMLTGIALIVLAKFVLADNQLVFLIGTGLVSIAAVAIVVIPMIQSTSKLKGIAKGLYNLYGLTGYIGDLVSYTRLMALGIAGGSIASAFNMLVEFMPPVARFSIGLVLLVALHALNIFLSLLSAYVHGARLQYVEFFGKFYAGGGRAFAPLRTEEKYVNIEKKSEITGGKKDDGLFD